MNLRLQFFAQNAHFAANLLAAFVMLMITWLFFDSWLLRKKSVGIWAFVGFLLLGISFAVHATTVEQTFTSSSLFGGATEIISITIRIIGLICIAIYQIIDPLEAVPKNEGIKLEKIDTPNLPTDKAGLFFGYSITGLSKFALPLINLGVAGLFWRRAVTGLESHLKPVALGFMLFAFADVFAVLQNFTGSNNVLIYNLTAPFGLFWIAEHLLFVAGAVVLGRWVGQYLVRQFQSQLFLMINTSILVIFLIITTTFTFLLMRNVTNESLSNLSVATKVLDYALEGKKSETLAHAESIAQNPIIASAVSAGDHSALIRLTDKFLSEKKLSSLIITNADGKVLLRAEDPDRYGDSISEDTSVRRAAVGKVTSTVDTKEAVGAPIVLIRSISPIKQGDTVIGTASVAIAIGDEFVDGIKKATGLESTVYAGNVRSATTIVAADGKSRLTGIREELRAIKDDVLDDGREFRGENRVNNSPYLTVYAPLKDVDNEVVGMLFAGKSQVAILQTAGQSIEVSFLVVTILLFLSIYPSFRMARFISKQIH